MRASFVGSSNKIKKRMFFQTCTFMLFKQAQKLFVILFEYIFFEFILTYIQSNIFVKELELNSDLTSIYHGRIVLLCLMMFNFSVTLTNTFGWTSDPNSFIRAVSSFPCSSFHSMPFYTGVLDCRCRRSVHYTKNGLFGVPAHG